MIPPPVIRHLNGRFILYTNGSATDGTLSGGAGMVVTEEDPANPTTLLKKKQRGTPFTSSNNKEKAAMRMALEWLLPSHAEAAICTDNQSLLKAIQSGYADTKDLRRMLYKRTDKTTLLWIPGHHGITGNEEANACAKQAAAITDGAPRPVSFAAASALIRQTLTDPPPCYYRTKEVYTKTFSWPADSRAASTRRDGVLLARLRAGHTPASRLTHDSLPQMP